MVALILHDWLLVAYEKYTFLERSESFFTMCYNQPALNYQDHHWGVGYFVTDPGWYMVALRCGSTDLYGEAGCTGYLFHHNFFQLTFVSRWNAP